jgi:hypothetical protein
MEQREQSPVRAAQVVSPLQGLTIILSFPQGFGCFAAFTLGSDAPRFQRSKQMSVNRKRMIVWYNIPVVRFSVSKDNRFSPERKGIEA